MGSPRTNVIPYLAGAGTGLVLAWIADPRQGRRRRAMLRDRSRHALKELGCALDKGIRDLSHRVEGRVAKARARFRHEQVDDRVIAERVRAELGRWVAHPHAIEVAVADGQVSLSGAILSSEQDRLICAVGKVRGVDAVNAQLKSYATSSGVLVLQGGQRRVGRRIDFLQENWAPSSRLLGGLGGASLLVLGLRAGLRGVPIVLVGGVLAARALGNLPLKRLFRAGLLEGALDLHKTIEVEAPVEEVFAFFRRFSNFPFFMEHLREVSDLGNGRSHWVAVGPAGRAVEWDAEVTRFDEGRLIAWKTIPGSAVEHEGVVRFQPSPGGTRLDIRLGYRPPAGTLGHLVASLFHKDPRHALDDDLVRFKSLLEEGKATAHGRAIEKELLELAARVYPR